MSDDEETLGALMGEAVPIYVSTLTPIASQLASMRQVYFYMDEHSFKGLLRKSISEGMKVYWMEILGRAHLAACAGILRQLRWLHAVAALAQAENFIGFSSALRGLLESSADALDALEQVAVTVADGFAYIQDAVNGVAEKAVLSPDLENMLIHFAFARRPTKGESVPPAHVAKSAADYNARIERTGSKRVAEMYKVLCEVTHPAGASVYCFIRQLDRDHEMLDPNRDAVLIKKLADEFRPEIAHVLQMGTNPMLLALKTLHEFEGTGLFTEAAATLDLSGIPGWAKLKTTIEAAKALRTRVRFVATLRGRYIVSRSSVL
jgi:hypothetical protein